MCWRGWPLPVSDGGRAQLLLRALLDEHCVSLLLAVSFTRDSFVVSWTSNGVSVSISDLTAPDQEMEYRLLSPVGEHSIEMERDEAGVSLVAVLSSGDVERSFSATRASPKETLS